MILIRDNKLVRIDTSEVSLDKSNFIAKKTLEMLKEEYSKGTYFKTLCESVVRDEIYKMICQDDGKYNFICIQSCWKDDSSLKTFITQGKTKGELILATINYGYKVFNGDVEITNEIT